MKKILLFISILIMFISSCNVKGGKRWKVINNETEQKIDTSECNDTTSRYKYVYTIDVDTNIYKVVADTELIRDDAVFFLDSTTMDMEIYPIKRNKFAIDRRERCLVPDCYPRVKLMNLKW